MKVPGILKNKYVLYVLLVIGIINVLGYISLQDYNSLALFVVLGLLSSYFSKNMAVNLLIAIVVTSFVSLNKFQEGYKERDEVSVPEANAPEEDHRHPPHPVKEGEEDEDSKCDPECVKGKEECVKGACVKSETFKNNVPSSTPASIKGETDESIGDRIDYAATMEQAYSNLQNMLGKDGMKSITNETKKLVSQQKDLMGTLNSMAPMLTSAKETLEGLNLKDMNGMSDILQKLQAGPPPKIALKKKKNI